MYKDTIMELPDNLFNHEDFDNLSEHEKQLVEKRIVEDAFENSYRVITNETTFEDLMDEMIIGKLHSALMAHNPDESPKQETLENMILHFGSDEYEEYEKCARLKRELNKLYPETVGKLII